MLAAASPLHDPEDEEPALPPLLRGEVMARLAGEMRHVDLGQGVGAFEDHCAAGRQAAQGRLGPQHRLRAPEAAEVQDDLCRLRGQIATSRARMVYLKPSGSRQSSRAPFTSASGYIRNGTFGPAEPGSATSWAKL